MYIVRDKITLDELRKMSEKTSGSFVKVVVDIEKSIMVVDAFMHADAEKFLLQEGSLQENLWGINLYPYKSMQECIEFYSTINLKPFFGNTSRWVEGKNTQEKIRRIVDMLLLKL
jgi:hypothetical protein